MDQRTHALFTNRNQGERRGADRGRCHLRQCLHLSSQGLCPGDQILWSGIIEVLGVLDLQVTAAKPCSQIDHVPVHALLYRHPENHNRRTDGNARRGPPGPPPIPP